MRVSARDLLIFIVLLLSSDVIDKTITPRVALFLVHTSRCLYCCCCCCCGCYCFLEYVNNGKKARRNTLSSSVGKQLTKNTQKC